MILYPRFKESVPVLFNQLPYFSQIPILESVILPKLYWIQINHHVSLIKCHMNMRRIMVVWIHCNVVTMFLPVKQFDQSDNLATRILYIKSIHKNISAFIINRQRQS